MHNFTNSIKFKKLWVQLSRIINIYTLKYKLAARLLIYAIHCHACQNFDQAVQG